MNKHNDTTKKILEQLDAHDIEFGQLYRDPVSRFEGEVTAMYVFKHACIRVVLRGRNAQTGEPVEHAFDAPELVRVDTQEPVPAGKRTGGVPGLQPIHHR